MKREREQHSLTEYTAICKRHGKRVCGVLVPLLSKMQRSIIVRDYAELSRLMLSTHLLHTQATRTTFEELAQRIGRIYEELPAERERELRNEHRAAEAHLSGWNPTNVALYYEVRQGKARRKIEGERELILGVLQRERERMLESRAAVAISVPTLDCIYGWPSRLTEAVHTSPGRVELSFSRVQMVF